MPCNDSLGYFGLEFFSSFFFFFRTNLESENLGLNEGQRSAVDLDEARASLLSKNFR